MEVSVRSRARVLADHQATSFDAIVIGSGFGGTMMAARLIEAGLSVLMLERGKWVHRDLDNWTSAGMGPFTEHFGKDSPYWLAAGGRRPSRIKTFFCVGGPSVFYGGVALRFRVSDFQSAPEVTAGSGATWPLGYSDLAPSYHRVEQVLGVAGDPAADPTDPPRSHPLGRRPLPIGRASYRLAAAARGLGFHPFLLPLAIQSQPEGNAPGCIACPTCDGFACAIGAKNDLATQVLPRLIRAGLTVLPEVVVTRLVRRGDAIRTVEAVDGVTGEPLAFRSREVILSAGALGSPHLILASGLDAVSPAPRSIGAYLMRHINSAVYGLFPTRQNPERRFTKQFGVHDLYHQDGFGRVGAIQQLATPSTSYVRSEVPAPVSWLAPLVVPRSLGFLTIAEDQPAAENRVRLDATAVDRFGLPRLLIEHRYSPRDHAADRILRHHASRILRAAGALLTYAHPIRTFSHAVGTLRMGDDPKISPVGPDGRFRGVENLWIADGSVLPRSGGVNPSLTIAATADRSAEQLLAHRAILDEVFRAVG